MSHEHRTTVQDNHTLKIINKGYKSPLIAYVLLIFLGALGLHRFYTGNILSGTLQLLLTILALIIPFLWVGVFIWLFLDIFLTGINVGVANRKIDQKIATLYKK